ncbi:MAG TPA: hypothetical protein VFZ78_06980 [Flavisolibacter sp.]
MKPAAIICALLFCATAGHSQLVLIPEAGLEKTNTFITANGQETLDPAGTLNQLRAALRLQYQFRKGHGVYLALGTSPSVTQYSFPSASTPASNFKTETSDIKYQIQGGYQFAFKPFSLGAPAAPRTEQRSSSGSSCSKTYKSHCGSKSASARRQPMNVRLVPSVGMAFRPAESGMAVSSTGYSYAAGNWTTAVVPALAMELGRGKRSFARLNISYTRGLNSQSETVQGVENSKPVSSVLESSSSSWGITLGVPFQLTKARKAVKTKSCESYRIKVKKTCGSGTLN